MSEKLEHGGGQRAVGEGYTISLAVSREPFVLVWRVARGEGSEGLQGSGAFGPAQNTIPQFEESLWP